MKLHHPPQRLFPTLLGGCLALAFLPLEATAKVTEESVAEEELALEDRVFFERRIRPILAEHCYSCHSEEAGKRKGGLWLDRRSGWELGGDSGPAIVPGHPEESLFIQTVQYHDPDLEMPPEEKLSDVMVERLEEWVRRGAPDPRDGEARPEAEEINIEEGREFWSFQPVRDPKAPKVKNADWPRDPVDRFLLARMEESGVTPAPDADRETLLRRASIVLTGLPPSVEDQEAFLADDSPQAFAKVVDRLLASEAYAERWGRHWLDISRYADTSGGGRALALTDAWRFRDFVIDSFREDKPLDELIREHIAGDLLPYGSEEERMEQIIGTGFLVLGPHNYENQDKELLDLEIADEQIDTVGRAFLGMTIGCARCHDHKFDPIPTQDYYSLAGIFLSTQSVRHSNVSKWYTRGYLPTPEQEAALALYDRKAKPLKKKIDVVKKEIQRLGFQPGKMEGPGKAVAMKALRGRVLDDTEAELVGDWQPSQHSPRWVGESYVHDQQERAVEKSVTWTVPLEKPGRYEVRISYSQGPNRATNAPVTVLHADGEETFRVNQRKVPQHDELFHSLGTFEFGEKAVVRLTHQGADGVVIADAVQVLPAESGTLSSILESEQGPIGPEAEQARELQKEYQKLTAELKKLDASKPKLPSVMAVADSEDPADTPVRIRGLPRNQGEMASRGFLQVAYRGDAPEIAEEASGRLELADWVASDANPLTARVLANRIWLHLFGEGLVRSPDNFGVTGDAPTHPELLDHIATRLIDNGWSARRTIRELVLSRAWQTAAVPVEGDLENDLFSHSVRRRLDAESLRDSILDLAGTLDREGGGPSLPEGFKSEFGHTFTSMKRSVYIPVFRNRMHDIFGAFDFANPNFVVGKRSRSTIPTQSLYLMNSAFMHEQGKAAASRLLEEKSLSESERVSLAYRRILCRQPTASEVELALAFLEGEKAQGADPLDTWAGLTRSLFTCIDFQYLP